MRLILWLPGCLLAVLAVPLRSEAHGLGADCKVNGNRVELEAYFDDDTAARDARVRVEDAERRLVAEGRTDAKGCWSFARPPAGQYRVVVDAGAGHRKELKITIAAETAAPDACPACTDSTPSTATISEGPDRAAFTAYPWLRLGIGVALLGGIGAAFWIARRIGPAKAA